MPVTSRTCIAFIAGRAPPSLKDCDAPVAVKYPIAYWPTPPGVMLAVFTVSVVELMPLDRVVLTSEPRPVSLLHTWTAY